MTYEQILAWSADQGYPAHLHRGLHKLPDGRTLWIVRSDDTPELRIDVRDRDVVLNLPAASPILDVWRAMIPPLVAAGGKLVHRRSGWYVTLPNGDVVALGVFARMCHDYSKLEFISSMDSDAWGAAIAAIVKGEI